jgi:hypothetical protein
MSASWHPSTNPPSRDLIDAKCMKTALVLYLYVTRWWLTWSAPACAACSCPSTVASVARPSAWFTTHRAVVRA